MKLARKLAVALILSIFVVMAVNSYLRVQRSIEFFEIDRQSQERLLGRVLRAATEAVAQTDDIAAAQELVRRANDSVSEVNIRWVWLDDEHDDPATRPTVPLAALSALRTGRQIVRLHSSDGNEEQRYAYLPITVSGGRAAALELSESLKRERSFIHSSIMQNTVATLLIASICGGLATLLGVLFVGKPIRALRDQARGVGAGDLSQRNTLTQRDEIGELATELNAMCDRLADARQEVASETEARIAAIEQLRHADRLKTVGQLASGIAHELGTPLNVILGRAKRGRNGMPSADEMTRSFDVIAAMADRMTAIIRQLLDFARRRGPKLGAHDVNDIVRHAVAMLGTIADKYRVELRVHTDDAPRVADVDANQIQQAIANLVVNGVQAMPKGGVLTVGVASAHGAAPGSGDPHAPVVRITVEDQGCGIDADALPHIFEPFFTTKGVGEGTGLGLSVAYGIVREHGGWITVESRPGMGSRFDVFLRAAVAATRERERA